MKVLSSRLYEVVYTTSDIKASKPCFRIKELVVADDIPHAKSILSSCTPGILFEDVHFVSDVYVDGDSEFDLPFSYEYASLHR